MVARRVSPMIWCGVRTRLILPAELWDELDESGRRAVIHHELAHLRRRDHWLCWLELLACVLYWWHPVVWWVRKRLRDEADLCCDAWVTALMPGNRRAYAQALLSTQRFLGGSRGRLSRPVAPPATGLGVMSGGAKRFARRLTMVMTQRARPHRTLTGMALAAILAAAGLTSASLACPPDKEKEEQERQAKLRAVELRTQAGQARQAGQQARREAELAARADRAPVAVRAAKPPKPPKAPKPPVAARAPRAAVVLPPGADAEEASTFERHLRARSQPGTPRPAGDGGDLEQRLDSLERRLDGMEQRMDRLLDRLERRGEAPGSDTPMAVVVGEGETVARTYRLPEDLSERICDLMAREDVPVLVTPGDGEIVVHGDEHQHRAFRNLVGLLSTDEGEQTKV